MNKIYKVIWNSVRQCYVVVSEKVNNHGKNKLRSINLGVNQFQGWNGKAPFCANRGIGRGILIGALIGIAMSMPVQGAEGDEITSLNTKNVGYEQNVVLGHGTAASTETLQKASFVTLVGRGARVIDAKADTVANEKKDDGNGNYATAIGWYSYAAQNATALGAGSNANALASMAIGRSAVANGEFSLAIGNGESDSDGNIKEGTGATTKSQYAIAIGASAVAGKDPVDSKSSTPRSSGAYAIALGGNTQATNSSSVAMSYGARSSGNGSLALGRYTNSSGDHSVALGPGAQGTGLRSLAIGVSSASAPGHNPEGATASNTDTIAMGTDSKASEVDAVAIGRKSEASNTQSMAVGVESTASGDKSTALGYSSSATGSNTVAVGDATATGESSVSIGGSSSASDHSTSLGGSAVSSDYSVALGFGATADSTGAVALGENSRATAVRASAFGNNATTSAAGGVAIGYASEAATAGNKAAAKQTWSTYAGSNGTFTSSTSINGNNVGAVSVGKADGSLTRQIVGVAGGTNDTDAVNVGQLKSTTLQLGGNNSSNGNVNVWSGKLNVIGATSGPISTSASGDTITINFDDSAYAKKTDVQTSTPGSITLKGERTNATSGLAEDNTGSTWSSSDNKTIQFESIEKYNVGDDRYTGNNLEVYRKTDDSGVEKVEILMKENPTFERTVTAPTFVAGSSTGQNTTINSNGITISGGPAMTKDSAGNSYITGLSNKTWVVGTTEPVSGRAATEDQLKSVSDVASAAKTEAGKHSSVVKGTNVTSVTTGTNASGGTAYTVNVDNLGLSENGTATGSTSLGTGINFADGTNTTATVNGKTVSFDVSNDAIKSVAKDSVVVRQGNNVIVSSSTANNVTTYTVNADNTYVNGGNVTYAGAQGNATGTVNLTRNDGITVTLAGLKDDYVTGATVKPATAGGKSTTVQFTRLSGATFDVDLASVLSGYGMSDYQLTGAGTNHNEAYIVADDGSVTLNIVDPVGNGATKTVKLTDIASKSAVDTITTKVNNGLSFETNTKNGNDYKVVKRNLGDTIRIKGSDAANITDYSTDNLTTTIDNDGNITIMMKQDITGNSVTVGKDGKDGKEGSIGIAGKDGVPGADGKQGYSTTIIKTEKGQPGQNGVNGKPGVDGTDITRIVYETNGENHTVATLDDGLTFKGDNTTVITKKLNEQVDIVGGADAAKLTDNNIGVNATNDGKLKVQLAKNINLTADGSITTGNTVVNNSGLTITNPADSNKPIKITNGDVSMGGNQITNVVSGGDTGTNAANIDDVERISKANDTNTITDVAGTGAITVTPAPVGTTEISNRTYTVGVNYDTVAENLNLQYTGDNNTSGQNKLSESVAFNGTANQIVTKAENGKVGFALADDIVIAKTVTAGGAKMGTQAGGGANTAEGNYVTGLSNTNWDANNIASGRAATEDQLKAVANDIKTSTVASDKYVTGGTATYADNGTGTAELTGTNGLTATVNGLHDYYITGATTSDDGKTVTLTKNGGDPVTINLSNILKNDMRLVANPVDGSE
ncbi:ESPR-type extended signal peptide-containing protein, partial [Veillonella caviae]|uniref:ESPR-type extended signal peptide-containing protein n=1 Tax=Veillonella caviae TaxID=248316 RepID=UPI002A918341